MSLAGRIVLVIIVALLAALAGLAFSASQQKEYSSQLRLSFARFQSPEIQVLGPAFAPPQVDENVRIQTEADDVSSYDVAVATSKANPRLGTPSAVASAVSVGPIRDTLVVTVAARASTARLAAQIANTYGEAYLALRKKREANQAKAAEAVLKRRYDNLPAAEKRGIQGGGLRDQINQLEVMRGVGTGNPQIILHARPSAAPASPDTTRNVVFGLLFGLVVGIGLVALRTESPARAAEAAARRASRFSEE